MRAVLMLLAFAGLGAAVFAAPAAAQVSNCQAIANRLPGAKIWRAATGSDDAYSVEISYVGHSTFRIVAPDGTTIATDFSGSHGADKPPDVVTMNHAHSSHWTAAPDPAIPYALKGWNPEGGRANHFLNVGEVLIRSVPSDIRSWGGTIEESGNSIFVFEIAGLCIGHLGHLHQELNDSQIAEIGRLDIVFVPIDGGRTMPHREMMNVIDRLRASLAIPMHWFSNYNLNDFAARTREHGLAVAMSPSPTIRVSLNTLPDMPTLMVLPRELPF